MHLKAEEALVRFQIFDIVNMASTVGLLQVPHVLPPIGYLMAQPAYECAFENAWIKSLGLNIHAPIFSHQLTKMPHELPCKLEGLLGGHAFAYCVWHMATQTLEN